MDKIYNQYQYPKYRNKLRYYKNKLSKYKIKYEIIEIKLVRVLYKRDDYLENYPCYKDYLLERNKKFMDRLDSIYYGILLIENTQKIGGIYGFYKINKSV